LISPFTLGFSLQKNLPDFYVVPRPDHPFLSTSPDLLVGGAGKLSAIFLVSSATKKTSLRTRLIAARLALPINTRMIAIVSQDLSGSLDRILRNFDEVQIYSVNLQSLVRYCSGDSMPSANRDNLQEVKSWHAVSYSTALQIASLRRRHEIETTSAINVIDDLNTRGRSRTVPLAEGLQLDYVQTIRSYDLFVKNERSARDISRTRENRKAVSIKVQGSTVAALSTDRPRSIRLKTYWQKGLDTRFVLDNGVPHPERSEQPGVLLVDEWPTVKH
jgi:hypothetical protein